MKTRETPETEVAKAFFAALASSPTLEEAFLDIAADLFLERYDTKEQKRER